VSTKNLSPIGPADIIISWLLKLGVTMLIHKKDDIEFFTEFPCFWDTLYIDWQNPKMF